MKLRLKTSKKTGSTLPEINLPDSWNKLSRKQLLFIAALFAKSFEQHTFKVIALGKLAQIKILNKYKVENNGDYLFLLQHNRNKFYIKSGLFHEMLKNIHFITQPPNLTKQLIPNFRWLTNRYFGPHNSCFNITYLELIHAELAFANYNNTNDPKHLDTLTAILYRRKKKWLNKKDPDWDGDIRRKFSAYTYQHRAKWFRLLPFGLKYAVYIFFAGSLAHMADEHPLCFKQSTVISSTPNKENPAQSLINLVPVITKGDPTKNEAIYNTPAWDIFDAYERMREEYETNKK